MRLSSYVCGEWIEGKGAAVTLRSAVTGRPIYETTSEGIDFKAALAYGRKASTNGLRLLTFHQRALMLKELAQEAVISYRG